MERIYKLQCQKTPKKARFFKTKDIKQKVPYKPKCGVETIFVQISDYSGIKIFEEEFSANYSLKKQSKMAKKGLAPKAVGKVYPILFRKRKSFPEWVHYKTSWSGFTVGYFYETELAFPDYRKYNCPKTFSKVDKLFDDCCKILNDCPSFGLDNHYKNVGWIDDKPFVIDFGWESWS